MSNWNHNFTALIRSNRARLWGNWGLDPLIEVGAVGIIRPESGAFVSIKACLPVIDAASIRTAPSPSAWTLRSQDVKRTEAGIDLSGSGTDPESGVKVTAGLKLTWQFGHAGSMASEFATDSEKYLDNPAHVLLANLPWLKNAAKEAGMGDESGIDQGFGVVTRVVYAKSGLNVGADSDNSSFSIEGSVAGVKEMVGEASGHGHYSSTSFDEHVSHIVWPPEPNTLSPQVMPIAFEFASFERELPLPSWQGYISGFGVTFRNDHGGTYVVKCTVEYTDSVTKKKVSQSAKVSGGLTQHFALPLSATKVVAHTTFIGMFSDDEHEAKLGDYPLEEWAGTNVDVNLSGIWPGKTNMSIG